MDRLNQGCPASYRAADYEAYADQVAAIEFIVVGYRVLEGSGVRVPLQPCAD